MRTLVRQLSHRREHAPLDSTIDRDLAHARQRPIDRGDSLRARRIEGQLVAHRPAPGDVATLSGRRNTGRDPAAAAREMVDAGAGELFVTAIDRDGTREGYDLKLIKTVSASVGVPLIACGGAGGLDDFGQAVEAGAAAVAAGSLFVHHGRHRAVLISHPERSLLEARLP